MAEDELEDGAESNEMLAKVTGGPPQSPPSGPPAGPPRAPSTGPPSISAGRSTGGPTMYGGGPPSSASLSSGPPSAPSGAQTMQTGSSVVVSAGEEMAVEAKKTIDGDEKVELERLREENAELKQGMSVAAEVIQDVENPPMPPIVGDGFVVPGEVVGMFSALGRQLHRERLVHGTAGSMSTLSTSHPGLVHISRRDCALGQLNEADIVTGNLGESGPVGAGEDWQIHSVALAIASLEHEGLGACIHVHAPYTTTMSLEKDRYALVPKDHDGKTEFGRATIVDVQYNDMEGYLVEITEALKQTGNKLFVARGHGLYALGANILDAWGNAAAFEHSMRILYLSELADL